MRFARVFWVLFVVMPSIAGTVPAMFGSSFGGATKETALRQTPNPRIRPQLRKCSLALPDTGLGSRPQPMSSIGPVNVPELEPDSYRNGGYANSHTAMLRFHCFQLSAIPKLKLQSSAQLALKHLARTKLTCEKVLGLTLSAILFHLLHETGIRLSLRGAR